MLIVSTIFLPIVVVANLSLDITELSSIDKKGGIALDSTDLLQTYKEKFVILVDDKDNPVVYLNSHAMGFSTLWC